MKSYTITEDTLNKVLTVLGSLPYTQSAAIIQAIGSEVEDQAKDKDVAPGHNKGS